MNLRFVITIAAFAAMAGNATSQIRRAVMTGGGNPDRGKCTIEVVVDWVAEVEIRGDTATLRNLLGQPAQWRRFECTAAMPVNPTDFRFSGVDGRGKMALTRDPRNGGGAVIRIEDPKPGSEGYTFDITWTRGAGSPGYPAAQDRDRRDYRDNNAAPPDRDRGMSRRLSTDDAVRVCQDAIGQQAAERFRTRDVAFQRTVLDDNPGRRDWILGTFGVRRGDSREEYYRFSCSVDFDNGRVRSAQIDQMEGGGDRRDYRDRNSSPSPGNAAMQSCQRGVEERLRRDNYERVEFRSIRVDDRPGRNDWIIGDVRAGSRYGPESFDFSCSVNLENGEVRSVEVRRR